MEILFSKRLANHNDSIVVDPAFYLVQETFVQPCGTHWHLDMCDALYIPAVGNHASGGMDGSIVEAHVVCKQAVEPVDASEPER